VLPTITHSKTAANINSIPSNLEAIGSATSAATGIYAPNLVKQFDKSIAKGISGLPIGPTMFTSSIINGKNISQLKADLSRDNGPKRYRKINEA
jgi:hypothetical protein